MEAETKERPADFRGLSVIIFSSAAIVSSLIVERKIESVLLGF